MFIDYYKLLNLSYTASNEEINQAYDKKVFYLNRHGNLTNNLINEEIKTAYTILINPAQRFKYNLQLIKKYQSRKSNKFKMIIKKLFKHDKD